MIPENTLEMQEIGAIVDQTVLLIYLVSELMFKLSIIEEWIIEAKTDCYGKDRMFVASFAFCVITFEPIII